MDKWWTNELPVVLAPCHMVTQVNYLNIMYQVQTSESPNHPLYRTDPHLEHWPGGSFLLQKPLQTCKHPFTSGKVTHKLMGFLGFRWGTLSLRKLKQDCGKQFHLWNKILFSKLFLMKNYFLKFDIVHFTKFHVHFTKFVPRKICCASESNSQIPTLSDSLVRPSTVKNLISYWPL